MSRRPMKRKAQQPDSVISQEMGSFTHIPPAATLQKRRRILEATSRLSDNSPGYVMAEINSAAHTSVQIANDNQPSWPHFIPNPAIDNPSWAFPFPPPSVTSDADACPISWDHIFDVKETQKRAYILRRPWKNQPTKLDALRDECRKFPGDENISTEGCRKRLKCAIKKVFEQTGIWFEASTMGIEHHPGMQNALKVLHGLDIASLGDTGEAHDDSGTAWFQAPLCTERRVAIYLDDGTYREVPVGPAKMFSGLVGERLRTGKCIQLHVEKDEFDRWSSFFAPSLRSTFPLRVNYLEKYWVYKDPGKRGELVAKWKYVGESAALYTMGHVLRVYCVSVAMESPDISDMIIDHVRELMDTEVSYRKKYRQGFNEIRDMLGTVPVLDFTPDDINYVWEYTAVKDTIRKVVFDMLTNKAVFRDAKNHVEADYESYNVDFLRVWKKQVRACIELEIEELEKTLHPLQESLSRIESLDETCGLKKTRKGDEHAGFLTMVTELENELVSIRKQLTTEENEIIRLVQCPTPKFPASLVHENARSQPNQEQHLFRNGLATEIDHDDMYTQPDEISIIHSPYSCMLYHNHGRGNSWSKFQSLNALQDDWSTCYTEKYDFPLLIPDGITMPKKAASGANVNFTINECSGYTIENCTSGRLGSEMLLELPGRYPDWDWQRVRRICAFRNGNPFPGYWHENTKDEFGRYPSHPGWGGHSTFLGSGSGPCDAALVEEDDWADCHIPGFGVH